MSLRTLFLFLVALALLPACSKKEPTEAGPGAAPTGPVTLNGAGATFPYPLYSKWMSEYNRLHPDIRINYASIGSGGGIRQIMEGTVDFGASDAPMSSEEEQKAPRKLWHVPMTIGAVAIAVNVAGVSKLQLSPDVLADIYLGKISKWNDARIAADNAGVTLPADDIKVVYRSDGSGTTAVFTEYLAKISAGWKDGPGVGKSVQWPVGLGAKGNEGVAGQTKTTPGSIGYVELAYARQNSMTIIVLKNRSGKFVEPSPDTCTAAAKGIDLPDTLHVSITDSPAAEAYPISAYTYLLVYEDQRDAGKGSALARFMLWAVTDGQKFSSDLHYAPLPEVVVGKVKSRLAELRAGDAKLLSGS